MAGAGKFAPKNKLIDCRAFAYRGDDVLQQANLRRMIQHVASDDRAHARSSCLRGKCMNAAHVIRASAQRESKIAARAKYIPELDEIAIEGGAGKIGQQ